MAKDIVKELNDLIQLDIDAIHAYDQAIEACEHPMVKSRLTEFRSDHVQHVQDLGAHVRSLGGTPEESRDFKGWLIEGFTAIMAQGDRSALVAMKGNEQLTNNRYEAALQIPEFTAEIRSTIEKNRRDEARHLQWINEALDLKLWERKAA
ncbi:MAG TPA: DUF2383 domain-containing protein [Candidatus Nanopelagicales bacterium]|nr:DUF2383 domain-containing protein [Candidatus Nanopelagicales bacterium]